MTKNEPQGVGGKINFVSVLFVGVAFGEEKV